MAAETLRLAPGPLALTGFFLPWAHGPGLFSATAFSGYDLVSVAGHLQQLDGFPVPDAVLWIVRTALVGVAVAAAWQTLLAPAHRRHAIYRLSGWYLALGAFSALVIGAWRSGLVLPPLGLLLWSLGAVAFAVPVIASAQDLSRKRISRRLLSSQKRGVP